MTCCSIEGGLAKSTPVELKVKSATESDRDCFRRLHSSVCKCTRLHPLQRNYSVFLSAVLMVAHTSSDATLKIIPETA